MYCLSKGAAKRAITRHWPRPMIGRGRSVDYSAGTRSFLVSFLASRDLRSKLPSSDFFSGSPLSNSSSLAPRMRSAICFRTAVGFARTVGFHECLAQLGRIGGALHIVGDREINLAFDGGFEIGLADLADAALHLVGNDDRLRMSGIGFQPAQDADRVARRCEGHLRRQHHHIHIRQQMGEVDQHVARQVDHGHFERLAKLLLQLHEGRTIGHQRGIDRCLRRQDRQIVVRADHRAFDEQAVDPAGIVDRVGQTAPRLQIERERAGAEMHVEIEQRCRQRVIVAEQPSERCRHHRCAHAAACADDCGRYVALRRFRIARSRGAEHRLRLVERVAQLPRRQGLEQIVVNTARQQVAIQAHVVHLPDGDDDGARLAHFGQRVDVVEGIAAFGQIDHQDVGAGRHGQGLDRVAQSALGAFFRLPAQFDDDGPEHVERGFIADEGGEGIAIAGSVGFPRCVHAHSPPLVEDSARPPSPVGAWSR